MSVAAPEVAVPPLSILAESEREIAENVHQFAVETIGPRSHAMDDANRIDPDLVRQFFELDLMGIEIPEELGGLGQTFGTSIAVIEALARVDAACAVVVDVQNTLVNNAILRWASPGLRAALVLVSLTENMRCGAQPLTVRIGMEIFAVALPEGIVTVPLPAS